MRRIAFRLGYDGTNYAGWQRQKNGTSVQQTLEETIGRLFGEDVHVLGSGRTDAGVHARGQVACVDLAHPIPLDSLQKALNASLPEDIRIYAMWEASPDFHPRFSARRKTYAYHFLTGTEIPPEYFRTYVLVPYPLDPGLMKEGLSRFLGTHDFSAFRSAGGVNLSCVRTIYQADLLMPGEIEGTSDCRFVLRITGSGFLYNMVRIMAGTIFEIGGGRLSPDVIDEAFRTGDRDLLGATAPAKGLMLMNVTYDSGQS